MTIKVSDEGGGIPRSGLASIWTYLYSTAKQRVQMETLQVGACRIRVAAAALQLADLTGILLAVCMGQCRLLRRQVPGKVEPGRGSAPTEHPSKHVGTLSDTLSAGLLLCSNTLLLVWHDVVWCCGTLWCHVQDDEL